MQYQVLSNILLNTELVGIELSTTSYSSGLVSGVGEEEKKVEHETCSIPEL